LLKPLVSIVIPTYNCARYLKAAVDSVLDQDYPDIELIVLDDGSTDETPELLREYDGRFFWQSHTNMGQSATLNRGWDMAGGELLGYLSADDILLPNAVSVSVDMLNSRQETVLSYCDYYLMDDSSSTTGIFETPDYDYLQMLTRTLCPPGPGVLFRRQAYQMAGHWDTRLRQVPDYDYWLRLGLVGPFVRIPEPLARFRVHSGSQTCGLVDEVKSEEAVEVLRRFFQRQDLPPEVAEVKGRAMSSAHLFSASLHLRAGRYGRAFGHIGQALAASPASLLSLHALKRLGYGAFVHDRDSRSVQ